MHQPISDVGWQSNSRPNHTTECNNSDLDLDRAAASGGNVCGTKLDNDLELKAIDDHSAPLLSPAKDKEAFARPGHFLPPLDQKLGIEDSNCYFLESVPDNEAISHNSVGLVEQTINGALQYPDEFSFLLGTPSSPVGDRSELERGFNCRLGKSSKINCPELESLSKKAMLTNRAFWDLRRALSDVQPTQSRTQLSPRPY